MNKNTFRIVFNKARGLLMVVAEKVHAHGRSAAESTKAESSLNTSKTVTLRPMAFAMMVLFGHVTLTTVAQAGGIVADPGAPANQRPVITESANGLPLVNIQTPSTAGVSRNTYSQFNVDGAGAILNNSHANVETDLGGWIQGNPYLANGTARVILNEVNSSHPSYLNGFIEIAGTKAQLVIANPAGISCDGCGFINANRATLTTGTPIVNSGNLLGYRVGGGTISFLGHGMDARQTDFTDVIARAVEINAGIWANQLNVVTGPNQVNTDGGGNISAITPISAPSGSTPAFAVDVAALGGMYAGKIHLIGTEAGLGVRNAGKLGASAGQIVVTVDGQLVNSGNLGGTAGTTIDAASIINTGGQIASGSDLNLLAISLTGDGQIVANRNVDIQLSTDFAQTTGYIKAQGTINLRTSGSISNDSDILAGGQLELSAINLHNTGDGRIAGFNTLINASGNLENRGLIDGHDTFVTAGNILNTGTGAIFGDHVALQSTTLTNHAESSVSGTIAARSKLDIGANDIFNSDDALIFSAGDIAIGRTLDAQKQATGQADLLVNDGATIEALGTVSINAAEIRNLNSNLVTAMQTDGTELIREIQPEGSPRKYDISYFPVINNFNIELQYRVNDNGVPVESFEDYTYYQYTATTSSTHVISTNPGQILSGGDMSLNGNVTNSDSQIIAGGNLNLTGGTVQNTSTQGQERITYSGFTQFRDWDGDDEELEFGPMIGYTPAPTVRSIDLAISQYQQNVAPTGTGTTVATQTVATPNSSLFQSAPNPTAGYFIETDPRFADYRTWLSSDYMMQQLSFDPTMTHKRLGDGFYEQRLIREQIAELTGRRFLDGYADDEAQYQALMNAGITQADTLQLIPGVALSAEQIAQLTSDIVWLLEKDVLLADGTQTKALVPQVYVRPRTGDLDPTQGLLAGNAVNIDSTGDITNSGTIAGRVYVALNGDNLHNLGGIISAQNVAIETSQNINNKGGTIAAQDTLYLEADRDIIIESTTNTSSNTAESSNYSRTNIDRIAGLYVTGTEGILLASAGNNLNTQAAVINSAGTLTLKADNNINLGTAETSTYENIVGEDYRMTNQTMKQEVTKLHSGGDMTVESGKAITAIGTQFSSDADITLTGQNVTIATALDVASSDYKLKMGDKKQKGESLSVQQISAQIDAQNNLEVTADQSIILSATDIKTGNNATFTALDQIAMLAAQNIETSSYEKKESGSFGSKSMETGSRSSETNTVSHLDVGGNLSIVSGGKQTHEATLFNVEGNASLISITDEVKFKAVKDAFSYSLHKSDSDLAWQSMEGRGATDEWVRTSEFAVNGQTVIDAAKNIRIDIKQVDGQSITQTIDAMVANNPNLSWLQDMNARGDINWQQVQELHDSWEYEESGLGPGAALAITIAVAAVSGGTGAGMVGATQGTMAAAAANATYISVVSNAIISTINNKGDLGAIFTDLTSSEALKGYVTDAATAAFVTGVVDANFAGQTDNAFLKNLTHGFDLNTAQGIAGFAQYTAVEAIASATIQTSISGGSFGDNLQLALQGAAIQVAGASLYNQVGNLGLEYGWADGSLQKTAMHALVGGLISEAVGGDFATGAIAAGASELLSQQLSSVVGNNPQLRTLASQLVAIASASVSGGDINLAVQIAGVADTFNRQLHPAEMSKIKQLANGDPNAEAKLTAAACALVHCADGIPSDDPAYSYLKSLQESGNQFASEKALLASQKDSNNTALFTYNSWDNIQDYLARYETTERTLGAVQAVAGVGGAAAGAVMCVTPLTCLGGAVVATTSVDIGAAGLNQAITGQTQISYGERILQSLGLSHETAAITYSIIGLSPAAIEAAVVNKAIGQAATYNALVKSSYADFATNGIKATPEVMASPQVQILVREIQLSNSTLTVDDAKRYAIDYIESGASLPKIGFATQDSQLIKVMPTGILPSETTGYWMTTAQAKSLASMTPQQQAQVLGLPASQAAMMQTNGISYYAITPKPGTSPKIFISDIASTTQGSISTSGGAKQVIVPNRNQWTTPVAIDLNKLP